MDLDRAVNELAGDVAAARREFLNQANTVEVDGRVPAGRVMLTADDVDNLRAALTYPRSDTEYLWFAHGEPDRLRVGNREIFPPEFAGMLRTDEQWRGRTVGVRACNTAADPVNGFVVKTAVELRGIAVNGPSDTMWTYRGYDWVGGLRINEQGQILPDTTADKTYQQHQIPAEAHIGPNGEGTPPPVPLGMSRSGLPNPLPQPDHGLDTAVSWPPQSQASDEPVAGFPDDPSADMVGLVRSGMSVLDAARGRLVADVGGGVEAVALGDREAVVLEWLIRSADKPLSAERLVELSKKLGVDLPGDAQPVITDLAAAIGPGRIAPVVTDDGAPGWQLASPQQYAVVLQGPGGVAWNPRTGQGRVGDGQPFKVNKGTDPGVVLEELIRANGKWVHTTSLTAAYHRR